MSDDRTPSVEPRLKPMTLTLAALGALTAGLLAVVFALLPPAAQPWNLSVVGAVALFAAARLGFWPGIGFAALALVLKDAAIYAVHGWPPYPPSYLYFPGYAAIGWLCLRKTQSAGTIASSALGASLLFFLVSNFVSWLEQAAPYGYSFAGLMASYEAGIPFYRGTFIGDLLFTGALFGAHAVLSRAYFPAERVAVVVEDRR